ncbi:5'-nucleotidase, lipoprotein e(P4) family [bacterium]|nr:5'-nucleotidase, lipoprotein e(P4) family [bacterium]
MQKFGKLVLGIAICFWILPVMAKPYPKEDVLPDQLVMATLWHQTAAEYRAIAYQTFNLARVMLDMELQKQTAKQKAIVLDLDETLLDNSPYQAMVVIKQTGYPHGWFEWIDAAQAGAIPGAVEFLKYADAKGVAIIYLSNRKITKDRKIPGMQNTLKNMRALGFPQADESHMYLRNASSSKQSRRDEIATKFDIIMLFGDNLNDHDVIFEHKGVAERLAAVDANQKEFGHRYFVLPNAMYGEWEGAVYDYQWRKSTAEKSQMRKAALNAWEPKQ